MPAMTDRTPTGERPDPTGTERVPIAEAAQRLGVTPDAVRARIHRGTLAGEREGRSWVVFLPVMDTPTGARPDAERSRPEPTGGDQSALIAQLQSENAYLREELTKRSDQLAAERERSDVLMREALARVEALTAGNGPQRAGDRSGGPFTVEPVVTPDLDDFMFEEGLTPPTPVNREWADLTDALIAELGMDPEAALIAAAQELGIPYGD